MFLSTNTDNLILSIILFSSIIPIAILIIVVLIKMAVKKLKKKTGKPVTNDIIDMFGGTDNILSVKRDLTRVTVELKNLEAVDLDRLQALNVGTLIVGNTIKCSSEEIAEVLMPLIK
jgi:hypothetical protein